MTDGAVALAGADDFRRLAIAAAPGTPLAAAMKGLARLEGEAHAWVSPARLRRVAPQAGQPLWEDGFGKVLAYAVGKGWIDAYGAVRAHIEVA